MLTDDINKKIIEKICTFSVLIAACLLVIFILAGCGRQEISLTIKDGSSETSITAYTREKVSAVLEEAEITVGENDVVTPELDYRLTEEDTEILIERYAAVTVMDGDDSYALEPTGATVSDAIAEAGITLGENDVTDQDPDAYLTDGMTINVDRFYEVTVILDGETSEYLSDSTTVSDLLIEQEVDLGDDYEIDPAEDTPLTDGMEIVIKRTIVEQVVEEEEVEYETTYENSSSLDSGKTSVKQEGVNGTKDVTYEVTYVNGEEVSREEISEEVTVEPVDEIILKGTKKASSSSGSSSGKTVDHVEYYDDCDGSGHGYKDIYYTDGSKQRVEY